MLSRALSDRQRPVRQHHLDRHLVEPDLGGRIGTDPHVAAEQHQRAGRERVPGAGGDDRDAAAVERPDEIAAVGDETHGLRHVAGQHHPEIEAGRELALAPVDDDGTDGIVGVGGLDRRLDARDEVERQRVHLAVVDV